MSANLEKYKAAFKDTFDLKDENLSNTMKKFEVDFSICCF